MKKRHGILRGPAAWHQEDNSIVSYGVLHEDLNVHRVKTLKVADLSGENIGLNRL
ncbi:hypothetical protein GJ744_000516 [Endocarpon pusillum]|uniref:Uncharacterized protein n=1 Tax=Endocarpon pusillum TaxID=364733 RepID=A0A8H7ADC3_9EURO|nr:hypothetical protein GJ744_000516 [Endocarpon pusillum]